MIKTSKTNTINMIRRRNARTNFLYSIMSHPFQRVLIESNLRGYREEFTSRYHDPCLICAPTLEIKQGE